jgi:hypothetical protein
MSNVKYKCKTCGSTEMAPEDKAPECCGEPMELLDVCTTAPSAEFARPFNEDDACDDGRAGTRI